MHCQGTRVSLRILEPPKMHKTIENVSVFNTAIKFNPLSIKLNLVSRVSINVQNIVFSSSYVKMSSQNCLRFRVTIVFFWWNMYFWRQNCIKDIFLDWIFLCWFYFIKEMTVYLLCMCKQIPFSDVINSQQHQPKISMQYIGFEKLIEQWIECAPHA